jgi:hypothetical protein
MKREQRRKMNKYEKFLEDAEDFYLEKLDV